jgi:DNA-binding transcriptional LysR family regulator
LQQNEVDFSLVSILPERMAVAQVELLQNKLFLVANPLVKVPRNRKAYSLFEQLPLIYREAGSGTRQSMERFLLQLNLPVSRKMELTSNEAVKQAVMAGLGVSIMPLIGIRNELQLGQLQIIPVKELPIQTTWRLIWLQGKQASPAARAFLDFLAAERAQIIQQHFDWYETY